jgi:hypothetical protein
MVELRSAGVMLALLLVQGLGWWVLEAVWWELPIEGRVAMQAGLEEGRRERRVRMFVRAE